MDGMTDAAQTNSCIVVGAGMSGLVAARELSAAGWRVVVLEGCRERGLPVAVTMAGGYARQVEDTVDIHFQTIKRASNLLRAERDATHGRL